MINGKQTATALCMACLLGAGAALAQQEEQGAMSAEEQAMMEAWQKAATPTKHHARLMESAGTWDVKQTMWMAPGAEPTVSQGTAERGALLGGRVLREKFSSTFMGQPYEGLAHSGYDNVTGKYWVTWMDNMSTAVYSGTGECDEGHTHCEYAISGTDPMGGTYHMRIEVDFAEDEEAHRFYETRDGEEFQSMKMVYTRAGSGQ